MVRRECARPATELRVLQVVSPENSESSVPLHATPCALEDDMVLPGARLTSLHAQQRGTCETQSKQHSKGMDVFCARALVKEIVNQNCFWPVNQTLADKLLRTSKRLIRYIALYSMAGVAMNGRMFRIPSNSVDVGFIDACAAYLTPKMALSKVLPSGANLRRVAIEPTPTRAPPERLSASTYREDDTIAEATTVKMDLVTPMFQPHRGEAGRAWFAIKYGIATDNSSLMSSESAAEREDTDEEIMSFNLGPEPLDPLVQDRLPSDEYLDDLQQGLVPGGSEPKTRDYDAAMNEMPVRHPLIDTMRQDMETALDTQEDTPMSPERVPAPIMGFSYDYTTDEPPTIQRIAEAPMHSSPYQEPPKLRPRAVPALLARDHFPRRSHRLQRQWQRWPSVTCQQQKRSPRRYLQLAQRHHQLPPPRSNAPEEGGVVAGGACSPLSLQVLEQGAKPDRQQQPRRHMLRAPCGRINRTGRY